MQTNEVSGEGLFWALAPIWGESTVSCAEPLDADGEWPIASLEAAGLQATLMCSLDAALEAVVRHIADRVAVMYLGQIMELTDSDILYSRPLHPYTQALLNALRIPDPRVERNRAKTQLKGDLPSPRNPPSGCVFRTRCPMASAECAAERPVLREVNSGHFAACLKIPSKGAPAIMPGSLGAQRLTQPDAGMATIS
jgi:oligopeptide/dipeptide ABC transporter ATP-binding protein